MTTPAGKPGSKWGRRGLLKGFGASALATAAVVFGSPGRAEAHGVHRACCHLVLSPSTWSLCANASDNYIWSCNYSPVHYICTRYQCCEAFTPYGTVSRSAYRSVGSC